LQGLLRNPLAEPGVLGVTATALYYGLAASSAYLLPVYAIAGALAATALLAAAATRIQSVVTLILLGVGLSSFSAAAMSLLLNLAPNPFSLADMINWLLGSVANRSFEDLKIVMPFVVAGMAILFFSRRGLSALTLGEEAASIRPFVGYDPSRSLIPSAMLAGVFLVVADIGVRLLPTATELKLGVVAAIIGAPAFIWIAVSRRVTYD